MQWHTPMGYRVINGKIEIFEEHRKIVEKIFEDYDNGISAWQIAKNLKEQGVRNVHDRVSWSHGTIGKMLENQNYLGTEHYPQIIRSEQFERVQRRREETRIEGGCGKYRPNNRERLVFSGTLICAECGGTYSHIQPRNKKTRGGIPKWRCKNYVLKNKVSCSGGAISHRQVEHICICAINMLIQKSELVERYDEKKQKVSPEYYNVERRIGEAEGADADEMMSLVFLRAAERYKTLEIRDESIKTEEMRRFLKGRKEIVEFDEQLYRMLIKEIIVYKENYAKVIFHNNSSTRIEYQKNV